MGTVPVFAMQTAPAPRMPIASAPPRLERDTSLEWPAIGMSDFAVARLITMSPAPKGTVR
jgi:hypothetical protein